MRSRDLKDIDLILERLDLERRPSGWSTLAKTIAWVGCGVVAGAGLAWLLMRPEMEREDAELKDLIDEESSRPGFTARPPFGHDVAKHQG